MAAASTEERELSLVNKVELRIALADTDAKLTTFLKTYMAPLLLKLASEHLSVRNKVISICQHLNTRLQSPSVELPVSALLQQFKDNDSKLLKHFDLLYAQQGFKRLSGSEKNDLVPVLIKGIGGVVKSADDQSGAQFFNLFLQALHHFVFPRKGSKEEDELRTRFEILDDDAKVLSTWFEKLILLELVRPAADQESAQGMPGVTEDERKFLSVFGRPGVWDSSASGGISFKSTKMLVLKLLSTGAFNDHERFMPALLASAHRDSSIADQGEDLLKHAIADVDINDLTFVQRLFEVYLGSEGRSAAAVPLQIKVLSILQRSTVSATSFPRECLLIIQRGISGAVKGREAAKLHTAVISFANFYLRDGKKADVKAAAPTIIGMMQQFIQLDQGWPSPNNKEQDLTLRNNAYEMIGSCAKAGGTQDIALLDWLFRSLSDDRSGRDTSLAIEHALSMSIDTFSHIYQDEQNSSHANGDVEMTDHATRATVDDLAELLYRYVEEDGTAERSSGRSSRYIAARFANRCLPYSNTIGRWIDILAAGGSPNEKMEVIDEGKKGLDPYWFSTLNADRKDLWMDPASPASQSHVQFPSFVAIFRQIFGVPFTAEKFERFMQRYPHALRQALSFCWRMFVNEALRHNGEFLAVDAQWERKIEDGASQDLSIRSALMVYAKHFEQERDESAAAFDAFVLICYHAMIWNDGVGIAGCQQLLVQALTILPGTAVVREELQAARVVSSLKSNNPLIRDAAAQVFGLVSLTTQIADLVPILEQLVHLSESHKEAIGATINQVNGALRAAAHALARRSYVADAWDDIMSMQVGRVHEVIRSILKSSNDQTLLEASYVAIEQFSIFGIYEKRLPLDESQAREIIDDIFTKAEKGNEKAIKALGRFTLAIHSGDGLGAIASHVEEKLYKLHEIRELGAQFAVGEALCCFASGWNNTALQLDMDFDAQIPQLSSTATLSQVLEETIKNCRASKPALRKAAIIWLLCLVQFCGHLPEVKTHLRACQAAFGSSLAERDELVQEAASRGLGLVYEKGDQDLRESLVKDLMQSFSSDKSNLGGGNVDEDTQLFDPGALRTGEGENSITTYRDILSLASEVGNPGMVYQFMSLAANNAVWSNRAAFAQSGLRSILSDSSVGGYLSENPKLYTKLYRYRFDPNKNVQRSMTDIWNSLVKDQTATIEKYFDPIMEDLLSNILTKEWRVRQACCEALADLVQGRPIAKYEKYLTDIWSKCFKVLDDIKQSVQKAALKLAQVISQILTRNLEAGETSTKSAEAMLQQVLPFLLSRSGLGSSAEAVMALSLKTILDIVKNGSAKALKPFSPELVERLIALFTDIEGDKVEYIRLNAAQYNISTGKLDGLRLNMVRGSPLMEAIDRLFDLADADTMAATVPAVEKAMKDAVGLPSKLACGNVLVSLTLRHRVMFKPYAGRFLKLLEKYSLDRNDTASSTYAAAAGYLCKIATDKQILRLVQYAKKLYLEDEDERHRAVSADVVRSISKQVPERFASLSAEILPLVFIAKHDGQETIKELSTKTWEECATTSAVSLHLREIMALCLDLLDSPRWNLKHSAARSVADATEILSGGYDGISEDQGAILWPALRKALDGKTWEGKEVVIQAFAKFAEKTKSAELRERIAPEVVKIALREAKRQNKDYQQYALATLGTVAGSFPDVGKTDWHREILPIVEPVIDDMVSSYTDKMEVDGHDAYAEDKRREQTLVGCTEALGKSLPSPVASSASTLQDQLAKVLELFLQMSPVRLRGLELATFSAIEGMFDKVDETAFSGGHSDQSTSIAKMLNKIFFQYDANGYMASVRIERAKAMTSVVKSIPTTLRESAIPHDVLAAEMLKEPASSIKEILKQIIKP